jgi:hypothetical protein
MTKCFTTFNAKKTPQSYSGVELDMKYLVVCQWIRLFTIG